MACVAALAVATVIGLAWRGTNGKMRRPRQSGLGRAAQAAVEPEAARPGAARPGAARADAGALVATTEIGEPLGERATLLQFSSAFCAPCRATRRILAEVAGMTEGVAHIEVDAESRLDLVRALGVLRTPTVLVLAADGRIVRRASGQPRKADVIGALGEAVESPPGESGISYSSGLETG